MKPDSTDFLPTQGSLFVISAPSGGGKTTLVRALICSMPDMTVSISHTTRAKRPLEREGVHYHFVSDEHFRQMISEGNFLEHANIFGHLYGTSRQWVKDTLSQGKDVILEIDWQGCQHIQQLFPDCISIFIAPPSPDILAKRLTERDQDHPEIIQERLADARETFSHIDEYDYIILNDDFEQAVADLRAIVRASRLCRDRQQLRLKPLLDSFLNNIIE